MKIHPPLFVIFIAIVWTAANEENSPIVRLERYEYNSPSGSKISPKTVLNDNILLCCFPLIRRNPIQQTTISCKTTCNLIRPTGALYVRDISDSSSSLPIRNRPQFSSSSSSSSTFISGSAYGYGHLTGSVPSGDTNGKLRSFKLRIPIPAIKPHYTASRGTVQEILIPKRFRQYKRICGNITHNRVYTKYEPPTVISNGYSSIYRYPGN
ncbi:unnamed protein product [Cercopithifilaria johnstoni]|uniref:Uncharacterized protein n=1 Tax=Cercopithifilaria johnstoni TaxID=2874296 RepID=A0A8J2QA92_9BILA|nr:unnamed protein product [Cercopithifilaria johnstoni]